MSNGFPLDGPVKGVPLTGAGGPDIRPSRQVRYLPIHRFLDPIVYAMGRHIRQELRVLEMSAWEWRASPSLNSR